MSIPYFGYDEEYMIYEQLIPVMWDYIHVPHILLFGGTGSGKTYCLKSLLGSISMFIPDAQAVVCDYKADDFSFLENKENYYAFDDCYTGLTKFYEDFKKRQSKEDMSRDFRLLVFDEWASFLSNLEKKEAEDAKKKLATLLMLGRSFNYHVIISQQRADAKYFDSARDNFSVIVAMGNISKESVQMFFSDYKDEVTHDRQRGTGHIYIDGTGLKKLYVPQVRNEQKLKYYISRIVK